MFHGFVTSFRPMRLFFMFTAITYSGSGDIKTLQRRVKPGWANCLLHQTERAAPAAGSPLFVEYT